MAGKYDKAEMFIESILNAFADAISEETCSLVLDSGVDSSFSISIRRHLIRSQLAQAPPLLLDISEVSDFDKSKSIIRVCFCIIKYQST